MLPSSTESGVLKPATLAIRPVITPAEKIGPMESDWPMAWMTDKSLVPSCAPRVTGGVVDIATSLCVWTYCAPDIVPRQVGVGRLVKPRESSRGARHVAPRCGFQPAPALARLD